jgi:hypothetical protein
MRAAKRRWTPSEQQLLEEMLAARKPAAQIGLILDRRAEAIWARIHRLKLKSNLPEALYRAALKINFKMWVLRRSCRVVLVSQVSQPNFTQEYLREQYIDGS